MIETTRQTTRQTTVPQRFMTKNAPVNAPSTDTQVQNVNSQLTSSDVNVFQGTTMSKKEVKGTIIKDSEKNNEVNIIISGIDPNKDIEDSVLSVETEEKEEKVKVNKNVLIDNCMVSYGHKTKCVGETINKQVNVSNSDKKIEGVFVTAEDITKVLKMSKYGHQKEVDVKKMGIPGKIGTIGSSVPWETSPFDNRKIGENVYNGYSGHTALSLNNSIGAPGLYNQ